MTALQDKVTRELLRTAGLILPLLPEASVVLQLLASSIELGTTRELAEAVLKHETNQLRGFRQELDQSLAALRRHASAATPSDN